MTNTIIIHPRNTERLNATLDAVQRRCRTRLINADHLIRLSKHYHHVLQRYFKVKDFEGLSLSLSPHADKYPKAYKYRPEGTTVEIAYQGGSWRLLSADREYCDDPKQLAEITYLPLAASNTAQLRLLSLSL